MPGMVMPRDRSTHKLLHFPVQLILSLVWSGLVPSLWKSLWFPRGEAGWELLQQWCLFLATALRAPLCATVTDLHGAGLAERPARSRLAQGHPWLSLALPWGGV